MTQKEIEQLSNLEISNYFINKAFSTTENLPEEARLYREELLERLEYYEKYDDDLVDPYENCTCEICSGLNCYDDITN